MEKISTRFAAGLTSVSILLSATPALAMGVSVDGSVKAHTNHGLSVHADSSSDVHGMHDDNGQHDLVARRTGIELMLKSDKKDDEKMARTEARAEVKATATVEQKEELLTRMRQRMLAVIKRAVNHVAKFTKRLCDAKTETDSTLASCMADAKAAFKLEVDAIIDASFSS